MSAYYIFAGAEKEKPGSGFIEKSFDAEGDQDAMEMAKRHYEGSGHTVWAHNGVDRNTHIQFRFVEYIDGPPKPKKGNHGTGVAAGGASQHAEAG